MTLAALIDLGASADALREALARLPIEHFRLEATPAPNTACTEPGCKWSLRNPASRP